MAKLKKYVIWISAALFFKYNKFYEFENQDSLEQITDLPIVLQVSMW